MSSVFTNSKLPRAYSTPFFTIKQKKIFSSTANRNWRRAARIIRHCEIHAISVPGAAQFSELIAGVYADGAYLPFLAEEKIPIENNPDTGEVVDKPRKRLRCHVRASHFG